MKPQAERVRLSCEAANGEFVQSQVMPSGSHSIQISHGSSRADVFFAGFIFKNIEEPSILK